MRKTWEERILPLKKEQPPSLLGSIWQPSLSRDMDAQVVDTRSSRVENQRIGSGNYNIPSSDLLQDTRESRDKYLNLCVPLYIHALNGDWPAAKAILDQDKKLLTTAIAKGLPTVLHVAAGANHVHFVEELLKLMDKKQLELQDYKGNTAFCFAATVGNLQIVNKMLQINPDLPKIRGGNGMTPLHFAALHGRRETARHLYKLNTDNKFEPEDWNMLFFTCIKTGITDLALQILDDKPMLAFERDNENKETALHVLAHKTSNFELVSSLWKKILSKEDSELEIRKLISKPSQLLFDAAKVGNVQFLAVLMKSCPDLIWELDNKSLSIIHIGVLHRHASIFNLIHEIGSNKDIILMYRDTDAKNNLLHLAAKLAPPERLELVSGAAFQMTLELLWFEEVKKIMLPSYRDMKNSEGITPQELFTREHAKLRKNAEAWMKGTANSCMLVSTLIATGVFAAAFTIPGGSNNDKGSPTFLKKSAFLIFAISDATALVSSATSILIFLSILISRYAQYDFYKSLPLKLISGLITLFISITSMMIAFGSAFFITYYYGLKWVPSFITVLASLPILLFVFLQFPLWSDIIYSTYYFRSLFRPSKRILS